MGDAFVERTASAFFPDGRSPDERHLSSLYPLSFDETGTRQQFIHLGMGGVGLASPTPPAPRIPAPLLHASSTPAAIDGPATPFRIKFLVQGDVKFNNCRGSDGLGYACPGPFLMVCTVHFLQSHFQDSFLRELALRKK